MVGRFYDWNVEQFHQQGSRLLGKLEEAGRFLARAVFAEQYNEAALAEEFDFLEFEEEIEEIEVFFLQEDKLEITELFRELFRYYTLDGNTSLDTSVILAVLREENLPIKQSLIDLNYLWFGYQTVIQENSDARKSK